MPPKKDPQKDAVVLVFDSGCQSEFYCEAKKCLGLILERKLLMNSADLLSLVICGPQAASKFELAEASWEMLRFVRLELQPSNCSDWLDGINVGANKLRVKPPGTNEGRIVIFSDFKQVSSNSLFNTLVDFLKTTGIAVTVIGPDHFRAVIAEEEPEAKKPKLNEGETASVKLIRQMWSELGDLMEVSTSQAALKHLTVLPTTQPRPMPWNCEMDIGDIRINITAFLKVKKQAKKPITHTVAKVAVRPASQNSGEATNSAAGSQVPEEASANKTSSQPPDESQVEESRVVWSERQRSYMDDDGKRIQLASHEIVRGFPYGNAYIPINEADKDAMWYKPGPKCLSVLGFSKLKNLPRQYVVGEGTHVIFPGKRDNKNDKGASTALSALVKALHEMNCGIIARKVYSYDRGLELVLCTPIIEQDEQGEIHYLSMADLAWKDDVRDVDFETIDVKLSEEQISAMDNFIDAMDLMTADVDMLGDPCEALSIEHTRERKNGYYSACLVERALHPKNPLPKELPEHLRGISWPDTVNELGAALKDLFPVKYLREVQQTPAEFLRASQENNVVEAAAVPKLVHPKHEPEPEDTRGEEEMKILFSESMFPPPRAVIYTLKSLLQTDETEGGRALACLERCVAILRAFLPASHAKEYNAWLEGLVKAAPDGAIYTFMELLYASPNGPFALEEDKNNRTLDQSDASLGTDEYPSVPKTTFDHERSQLLNEFF